jgi:hypothetical protein
MKKEFVGVVNGSNPRVVHAATVMMDLVHFASLPAHTNTTLAQLDNTLQWFHANKDIFIQLGGCKLPPFNLNKLHMLLHYTKVVQLHNSLDRYNTKCLERLHIDFAKKGYWASNHINYTAQMTLWMCCQEAIALFCQYIDWVVPASPKLLVNLPKDMSISKNGTLYSVLKTSPWPDTPPSVLNHVFKCDDFTPVTALSRDHATT